MLKLFQAAQSEAGKKGAAISASRPEEERKAAGQKAAETRYGQCMKGICLPFKMMRAALDFLSTTWNQIDHLHLVYSARLKSSQALMYPKCAL